jgi:hypothetical protein
MPSDSRNPLITKRAGGIEKKSRTGAYKAKNLWKDGKKKVGVKKVRLRGLFHAVSLLILKWLPIEHGDFGTRLLVNLPLH